MRENEAAPAVSIVVPVRNEAGNIAPLVAEIERALAGTAFEIVYVNDGSTDGTEAELASLKASRPWLRQIKHAASCGQSSAVRTGVAHARAPLVVTLDGDGQNDPAFMPKLLAVLEPIRASVWSPASASAARIPASRNSSRASPTACASAVLRDGTRDTGCGLKAFRRDLFLSLPYFDGLHRFLPALVRREGYEIGYVDVVDRQRGHGVSNYGLWDRLWVGILDLVRGVVARAPQEARAGRNGDRLMLIQFGTEIGNFFRETFVDKFDFWLVFGLVAQLTVCRPLHRAMDFERARRTRA